MNHAGKIELRVAERDPHFFPAELVAAHVLATLLVTYSHHPFLFFGEEVGLFWVVRQSKPDEDGTDGTEKAFDDIHPS